MAEGVVSDLDALISAKKPTLTCVIRDFQKYIGSPEKSKEIATNIRFVLDNFQPDTHLGKLLRIKLINKFKVYDEVFELLKSGDSLDVSHALKCDWYFANVSDPANFVDNFIPCLSVSARLKVLNKYASLLKNTEAAEVVYTGVKLRYGTRTAVSILPACCENFIRNELPNIKIALPPGIVLSLFKKYPSLSTEYIKYIAEDSRKSKNLSSYETVLVKLASKDLETFLELTRKHALPCIKLGRRSTKKLLKTRNEDVINNYNAYKQFLKEKIFFSRLSLGQIQTLFVSHLLPSRVSDFLGGYCYSAQVVLGFVKPVVQSNIVLNSFKTKYGRELTADDVVCSLAEDWVKYLPAEAKQKWVEGKIQENVAETEILAKYVAQLPVGNAMPKLKQLIESQSNPNVRTTVAVCMVDTLQINQHSAGIKDLFAYFVRRFRNEIPAFRCRVLTQMSNSIDLLLNVEPDDWAPIIEFINIMKLNREVYASYSLENAIIKILDCRVQNSFLKNGNTELCLKDYLDLATGDEKSCNYEYLKLCENTPYRSFCLQWLLNVVPQMSWADATFARGYHARLYELLVKFNSKNPQSSVPCPSWLTDSINSMINDEETPLHTLGTIRNTVKMADVEFWRLIIKRTAFRVFNCTTFCEILKFEPTFVMENILKIMEKMMNHSLEYTSAFYKKARLFDPFGIPSEIAKLCRISLKLEEAEFDLDPDSNLASETSQPHAVGALAIILPSKAFLEIALTYVPVSSKVEDFSEESQALHDIQKAVGKAFTEVTSAVDVLPVAQKFAVGDYLKFVSGSLISVCSRVPENRILPMLKSCIDCPVSLRKHYLKLLYKIAPSEERVRIFVDIFKMEKNVSLRLVLFQLLRKAFIDEPDEETFRTLKSILNQLTEEDLEALKELFNVDHVEDDFVEQYLELIWELSGSKWASAVPKGKSDIVNMVGCREIKLLSEGFSYELLSHELSNKLPNEWPSDYVCAYLLHAPSSEVQAARLYKVMASLQPLITTCWDEFKFSQGHVFPVRRVVVEMVQSLCTATQNHVACVSVHPVQLLESAKQALAKVIRPSQFIRQRLQIDVAIRVLQNKRSLDSDSALTDAIIELFRTYLQASSEYQPVPLATYFVESVPFPIRSQVATALTSDVNPVCQIAGLSLLSTSISDKKDVPMYKSLIETLSASDNPAVQALTNDFFSSLESIII